MQGEAQGVKAATLNSDLPLEGGYRQKGRFWIWNRSRTFIEETMKHRFASRLSASAGLLLVVGLLLVGIQGQQRPAFKVASVKPSGPQPQRAPTYLRYGPQSLDAGYYPLVSEN